MPASGSVREPRVDKVLDSVNSPPTNGSLAAEGAGPRAPTLGIDHDIASACLYLACDEASFIPGVVLAVDGGRTNRGRIPT